MKFKKQSQHGVWAMIFAPIILGIIFSNVNWYHLLFVIAWTLSFMTFDHMLFYFKKRNKRVPYLKSGLLLCIITTVITSIIIVNYPQLIYFYLSMIPFIIMNLYFSISKKDRLIWNDIAGITNFAIGGLMSGWIGNQALHFEVFILTMLFFIGTVFFVKTMIREKNNPQYKLYSWVYHSIALIAVIFIHPLYLLAFLPSLIRSIVFYGQGLPMKKIGIIEIVNVCWFVIIIALI